MQDWLQTILTSATVTVFLGGIAATLFKDMLTERLRAAIKSEYDAKLESHKAQLQSSNSKELEILKAQLKGQADVELEQLKSKLQVQASQQNLAFGRLHEKRVEAIAATHAHLIPVRDAVETYIAIFQPAGTNSGQQLNSVEAAYKAFRPAFSQHQVFLPRNIAAAVERLDRAFVQVANQFTLVVRPGSQNPNIELWMKLVERFQSDVNDALSSLREDMRIALGDHPSETAG